MGSGSKLSPTPGVPDPGSEFGKEVFVDLGLLLSLHPGMPPGVQGKGQEDAGHDDRRLPNGGPPPFPGTQALSSSRPL